MISCISFVSCQIKMKPRLFILYVFHYFIQDPQLRQKVQQISIMTLTNVDKNPYKKSVGFITLTVALNDNSKRFEFGTLWGHISS